MKLIDEKEIEGIKLELIGIYGSDNDCIVRGSVNTATKFAKQKIKPMMIEFAEWTDNNYLRLGKCFNWVSLYSKDDSTVYTTSELLEEFIKTKQNG